MKRMRDLPPAPRCSFASDNAAGAAPAVIEAMAAANVGPALAYGEDPWTRRAIDQVRDLLGGTGEVLLCWGGTGANIVGLASMLAPWQSVLTVDSAHIIVDECGGPARFTGSTITTVANDEGKLRPDALAPFLDWLGVEHHPQPRVVSVSQVTEMGTVYTPDELAALAEVCRRHDLLLHLDGARIANALVASGATLAQMVRDTGVDVFTFGFTKNGAVFGEAVVYLDAEAAGHAAFVRKQAGQLVSKSRFAAAQVSALLDDDLWLANARHANEMAQLLADECATMDGVRLVRPPQANALLVELPWDRLAELQAWSFFWPWDPPASIARWMTSFATTPDDVRTFAAGVRRILAT
jgi:threonine aldolase